MTQPVIMWFRQDLRTADHPAFAAATAAGPVVALFILDDETAGDWRWGGASRWWLHYSLAALSKSVKLVLRRGRSDEVLRQLIGEVKPSALYFTRDHAPWSTQLETRVKSLCDAEGVNCHRYGGSLLHEPESIRNGSGQFFKVYTPFSKACLARGEPRLPRAAVAPTFHGSEVASDRLEDWRLLPERPNWARGFSDRWRPGEDGARERLVRFLDGGLRGYADGRDRPDLEHFSGLSPHLHWGEISPHQVWASTQQTVAAAGGRLDRDGAKFLKEVLWREFSYHLLHHVPDLPTQPFRPEFSGFPWHDDPAALARWQRGETGYPIVDAGLRELWSTGFMHNRVRMIVASFLVKDLLVQWVDGERWFWDTLVDADIGNNAASWQWVAGCGADAAPYFRVFNPVLQGEKFDPKGAYVRQWLPELNDLPESMVHRPWEAALPPRHYPTPMIDHGKARARALDAFKTLKNTETA